MATLRVLPSISTLLNQPQKSLSLDSGRRLSLGRLSKHVKLSSTRASGNPKRLIQGLSDEGRTREDFGIGSCNGDGNSAEVKVVESVSDLVSECLGSGTGALERFVKENARELAIGSLVFALVCLPDEHALALGPGGPVMEEFWDNVRRYGFYFFTVVSGGLYSLAKPLLDLLKDPSTQILVLIADLYEKLRWHRNCYWEWQYSGTFKFLELQQAVVDSAKALCFFSKEGRPGARIAGRLEWESMQYTTGCSICALGASSTHQYKWSNNYTNRAAYHRNSNERRSANIISSIACYFAHGYSAGKQISISSACCPNTSEYQPSIPSSYGDGLIESCCASHSPSKPEVAMNSGSSAGSLFSRLQTEAAGIFGSAKGLLTERKFFLAGNWKCNGSQTSVKKLVDELNAADFDDDVDVVVCPPSVYITQVLDALKPRIEVAAQNCWTGEGGAFTEEISADQLVDVGVKWVVAGHAERRNIVGESNDSMALKASHALSQGLSEIIAIGETHYEHEENFTNGILFERLQAVKKQITNWSKVVLAYEPVWAIGTGRTCTPQQAQGVHAVIRGWMRENTSEGVASSVRITFGASVSSANCDELAKHADVDGFCVGRAAWDVKEFSAIANSVKVKKVK